MFYAVLFNWYILELSKLCVAFVNKCPIVRFKIYLNEGTWNTAYQINENFQEFIAKIIICEMIENSFHLIRGRNTQIVHVSEKIYIVLQVLHCLYIAITFILHVQLYVRCK